MGHNPGDDTRAAMALAALIDPARQIAGLDTLRSLLVGQQVIVAGPALTDEEKEALPLLSEVVIAADSALRPLHDLHVRPGVVVTDLDGEEELLLEASEQGVVMVVHAHGDNMEAMMRLVPLLAGPIVGTCQVMPPPPLVNYGGYTDGDRAVLLALAQSAIQVRLVGFDLDDPVRKEGKSVETKRKKLRWAREIIEGERAKGAPIHPFIQSEEK